MTDRIVRIKSSRPGYRRGGREFGSDWSEIDTSNLSRDQQRAILADGVLTIEGREDDGSWTSLTDEIRGGLLSLIASAEGFEGVETPFDVDPGMAAQAAELAALRGVVDLHQADLEGLKLWPVDDLGSLLTVLINGLGEAEAVIDGRAALIRAQSAEIEALKAELAAKTDPAVVQSGGDTSSADGADDAPVDPAPKPNRQAPAKSKAAK